MGVLTLAFGAATMMKAGTHPDPVEALVSHVSNVGNPTTAPAPGMR